MDKKIAYEVVRQRVIEVVMRELFVNKEQVTNDAKFIEDLGADSLDVVELIMVFDQEFTISIPDEHADQIETVDQAVRYITALVNGDDVAEVLKNLTSLSTSS